MKHLAKILNLEKYEILVGENSVVRGSPLSLLGENGLSFGCNVIPWTEHRIGKGAVVDSSHSARY